MKTIYFVPAFLLSMFLASCSTSDDETSVNDGGRRLRQLTIAQVEDGAASRGAHLERTRASLIENADGETLSASWTEGDRLTYCNLTCADAHFAGIASISGDLNATRSTPNATIVGGVECALDDRLALVYPAASFGYNNKQVDGHYAARYTIDLRNQDGTLETIAQRFHHVYGEVVVTGVDDNTASGTVRMESLLTVCRFTFVDKANQDVLIPVRKLIVKYDLNDYEGKYPQTATLVAYPGYHAMTPDASDSALSIDVATSGTEAKEVYAALLPIVDGRFVFTVVNDEGTYEGTAKATLNAGEFVPARLKLTKTNQ